MRNYDNASGKCVPSSLCPSQIEESRISGYRPHICSFIDGEPIICCPLGNILNNVNNRNDQRAKRISIQSNYLSLSHQIFKKVIN